MTNGKIDIIFTNIQRRIEQHVKAVFECQVVKKFNFFSYSNFQLKV